MLVGYFDDSGSQPDGQLCVLAGPVAHEDQWVQFEIEWAEALSKPPGVSVFKANHAFRLKHEFADWTPEQVFGLVDDLCGIIKRNTIHSVSITIDNKYYRSHLEGRVQKFYDHPYLMCFYLLLYGIKASSAQILTKDQYTLYFDEQGVLEDKALDYWHEVDPESKVIHSVLYADDCFVAPLQAADLIAWMIRRKAVEVESWPDYQEHFWKLGLHLFLTIGHEDNHGNVLQEVEERHLIEFCEATIRKYPREK